MTDEPPIPTSDLETRVTELAIRLGILGLFVYWSLTLVGPFVGILVWAVILAVALHPVFRFLKSLLGGRGSAAAFLITLIGLALVLGPVALLTVSMADTAEKIATGLSSGTLRLPPPPDEVIGWPLIGEQLHAGWTLASGNIAEAARRVGPILLDAGGVVLGKVAGIGAGVLMFAASVVISGFLFVPGPRLARGARRLAGRVLRDRGEGFVDLAGATIRNVSRGVVGVSALQALLSGVIMYAAAIPGSGFLAAATLLMCIVQVGPVPVLAPVIIWVWTTTDFAGALVFTLVMTPVILLDNVLKPYLMARGLKTPMIVILIGVLGGAMTHGLLGLFIGPVVLAVFYELLSAWAQLGDEAAEDAPRPL